MSAYRSVKIDGRVRNAHRVAWERVHGPVPPGMEVMHTCDTPSCDDVEHLVLGTHGDNMRDMMAKGRGRGQFKKQDACKRGHPLVGDNLYIHPKDGVRECRACRDARNARRKVG